MAGAEGASGRKGGDEGWEETGQVVQRLGGGGRRGGLGLLPQGGGSSGGLWAEGQTGLLTRALWWLLQGGGARRGPGGQNGGLHRCSWEVMVLDQVEAEESGEVVGSRREF